MRPRPHSPTRPARAVVAAAAVLFAALVAAALGGCGGGDETSPAAEATVTLPTGTLSRSELASEADSLCADMSERILNDASPPDFGTDGPQPDEVKATAPFWQATATEGQTLIDQLSQLQPPKSEQQSWDAYVKMLERGTVDYANSLLGPAQDGDPDAFYQAAVDAQRDLIKLARASKDLGLKVCGARDAPPAP